MMVWGAVCVGAFWCFLVLLVLPVVDPIVYASGRSDRVAELEERKRAIRQTLSRIDAEQDAESQLVNADSAPGIEHVLELIQRGAQSARVRVESLTSNAQRTTSSDERLGGPYRFSVQGTFPGLSSFVETVSQTTNGLLLSKLAIHNRAWPDFSGALEAEITLELVKSP
jgi:hypothetical protein